MHTDEVDYREIPRYVLSVKLGVAWEAPAACSGFHGRGCAKIMGGETYVDCGAGDSLGAGELLGAGGILTSKPFEASGGLRVQSSGLEAGPVNLDVSSDLSVLALVPGERGDLPLQGDARLDDVVEEPAGDAPVEGPTLKHCCSKLRSPEVLLPSHSGLHNGLTGDALALRSKACRESTPRSAGAGKADAIGMVMPESTLAVHSNG